MTLGPRPSPGPGRTAVIGDSIVALFGAERAHSVVHLDDENLDGYMDLTFHFWTRETGIQCFDTEATIWGAMLDGTPFVSTDSINTVGCREPEQPRPVQETETVVTPPAGESDVFGDNE